MLPHQIYMHFLSPVAVQISKALAPESIEDKERFCVLSKFGVSLQDYVSQIYIVANATTPNLYALLVTCSCTDFKGIGTREYRRQRALLCVVKVWCFTSRLCLTDKLSSKKDIKNASCGRCQRGWE